MPTTRPKTLEECTTPQEALIEFCLPFVADRSLVRTACAEVHAAEIPEPFHWLLVHRNHMTKVLEAQYGRPMELDVIKQHLEDDLYTRKIILRPQATNVITTRSPQITVTKDSTYLIEVSATTFGAPAGAALLGGNLSLSATLLK